MTDPKPRIIFMGTPDFSVPPLEAIVQSHLYDIVAIYTQPPRPKNRGQQIQKSPVHEIADKYDIPVYHPQSFKKDQEAQDFFRNLKADIAIVAAYGLILPTAILQAPRYGCINIHASILPRWRGASPIQHAILYGDSESGITLMQMEEGLDTGPIIDVGRVEISPRMTSQALHDLLSDLGADMVIDLLGRITSRDVIEMKMQDNNTSIYAPMLKKEDGHIIWSKKSEEIDRQLRAFNPWPGTWSILPDGRRFKIISAICGPATDKPHGYFDQVTKSVACGDGFSIILDKVQPESARLMSIDDAIHGGYLKDGFILS